ncbi:hypothetical protein BJ741DRAFT_664802 [Chytriomyces cf. hyalinus JEL632]|nr:hypothetical protein BJ741DRAFT_664802 [Chytriomyces cf. hyalinus JEL632]
MTFKLKSGSLVPEIQLPNVKYLRFYLQTDGIGCTRQTEVSSHQPSTFDPHVLKSLDPKQISVDDDVNTIDPGATTLATCVNLRELKTQLYRLSLRNKVPCGVGSEVLAIHGASKDRSAQDVQDDLPATVSDWAL